MTGNRWEYKLHLEDVFHNPYMNFEEIRDAIVRRIRNSRFWDDFDSVLILITDDISSAANVFEFDHAWDAFYDWADDRRVWVTT